MNPTYRTTRFLTDPWGPQRQPQTTKQIASCGLYLSIYPSINLCLRLSLSPSLSLSHNMQAQWAPCKPRYSHRAISPSPGPASKHELRVSEFRLAGVPAFHNRYIYIHIYVYICMYICMYVYMYVIRIYINTYTHIHMYHICIYIYMYMCMYTHTFTCLYIHIYIYLYVPYIKYTAKRHSRSSLGGRVQQQEKAARLHLAVSKGHQLVLRRPSKGSLPDGPLGSKNGWCRSVSLVSVS